MMLTPCYTCFPFCFYYYALHTYCAHMCCVVFLMLRLWEYIRWCKYNGKLICVCGYAAYIHVRIVFYLIRYGYVGICMRE